MLDYSKHVNLLARQLIRRWGYNSKGLKDDLIQQGYLGVLEALNNFDAKKSTFGFWSYAYEFVRGRMRDFIIDKLNIIRPTKSLNSITMRLYKEDMVRSTPEFISEYLGCTIDMATRALEYSRTRKVISLNQTVSTADSRETSELIDLIQAEEDLDRLFVIEVMSGLTSTERGIIRMLIDHYNVRDIMRHYKLSNQVLNHTLIKILECCGYDYRALLKKSGGWLMKLDQMDFNEGEDKAFKEVVWVPLERILPNPKNPRKNLGFNTEQIQYRIKEFGWEVPLTCYRSGDNFILISGHRRWYAAVKLNEKVVPIFIVDPPRSDAEELDRIGSVQGGQVGWSQFDQIKYTYDLWISSDRKPIDDLALEMGINKGLAKSRIRVYEYYPKEEIEGKLNNGRYSIMMLDYILTWIKRLAKHHSGLVESLGEHYIRRLMLKKYEERCYNSQIANDHIFVTNATSSDIQTFLLDITKRLDECQAESMYIKDNEINTLKIVSDLNGFQAKTKVEAERLLSTLDELLSCIDRKKEHLDKVI